MNVVPSPTDTPASAASCGDGALVAETAVPGDPALPETPDMAAILAHGEHVARLADSLFADLAPLHRLDEVWGRRLREAARLHDLGLAEGRRGHHKASMRLIESDLNLDLTPEDRPFVALLARYHRRALPTRRHRRFAALSRREREAVRRCAALLRVADGLDYTHAGLIDGVGARAGRHKVRLDCRCGAPAADVALELERAREKSDLFRRVYKREVEFTCLPG